MNGVLVIDKPVGPTSHDIVAQVRRAAAERRVGHAGTLDPLASGVLLLCLGEATKLVPFLMGADKEYRATLRLGVTTDTDDADPAAQILGRAAPAQLAALTAALIHDALQACVGLVQQRPPAFSALKVQGQRLHERARALRDAGSAAAEAADALETSDAAEESPEQADLQDALLGKTRAVHIYEIRVEALRLPAEPGALPEVDFWVRCGKGTYIRAIARDVGERLGVGGHLCALRRLRVGRFTLDQATPLLPPEQPPVEPPSAASAPPSATSAPPGRPRRPPRRPRERLGAPLRLFREAEALQHLPALTLDAATADRVRQGHVPTLDALLPQALLLPGWPGAAAVAPVAPETPAPEASAALLDEGGCLAAVVVLQEGRLRIGRGFSRPSPGGASTTSELTPPPVGRKTTPQD